MNNLGPELKHGKKVPMKNKLYFFKDILGEDKTRSRADDWHDPRL